MWDVRRMDLGLNRSPSLSRGNIKRGDLYDVSSDWAASTR
jgi:hypothetical protein